jgi:hypothetical protein
MVGRRCCSIATTTSHIHPSGLTIDIPRMRKSTYPGYKSLFVIVLFFLTLPSAHALQSDRKARLNIVADSGTYNFKTGVDIYEGHVKSFRGELIHYNSNDQTITLPESANGQAMLVYNPDQ